MHYACTFFFIKQNSIKHCTKCGVKSFREGDILWRNKLNLFMGVRVGNYMYFFFSESDFYFLFYFYFLHLYL